MHNLIENMVDFDVILSVPNGKQTDSKGVLLKQTDSDGVGRRQYTHGRRQHTHTQDTRWEETGHTLGGDRTETGLGGSLSQGVFLGGRQHESKKMLMTFL